MRNFIAALLFIVLSIEIASADQRTYDMTLNFDNLATGSVLGQTALTSVLAGQNNINYQWTGDTGVNKYFHIQTNATSGGAACRSGHKCVELTMPPGLLGQTGPSGWGTMDLQMNSHAAAIINVEYDFMYEPGFDLHDLGKIPMVIQLYDTVGTGWPWWQQHINWQCQGGNAGSTGPCPTYDDMAYYIENPTTYGSSGGGSACGYTQSTTRHLETGIWYHFHHQMKIGNGTTEPYGKIWSQRLTGAHVDGSPILEFDCEQPWSHAPTIDINHNMMIEFTMFCGGAGTNEKCQGYNYGLVDNLHIYTGLTPQVDVTAPTVPANLAVTTPLTSLSAVTMTWAAATDPDSNVFTYHLKRDNVEKYAGPNLTFTDTGLTPGQTYAYTVSACDATPNCSADSAATNAVMTDVAAPSVPANLRATLITPTEVDLAWSFATDLIDPTPHYKLYRDGGLIADQAGCTFLDTGRSANTTYNYTVAAYDITGNASAQSSQVPVTTLVGADSTPPTTPTAVHLEATGSTQVNLAWTPSTDNVAVQGYVVKRCQGQTCSNYVAIATVTDPHFSDTGLLPKTNYNYIIEATDGTNVSGDAPLQIQTEQAQGTVILYMQGH